MSNTGWNTRVMEDGRTWLVWEGQLRVPLDWDPNSGVFIAVTPPGGLANLPALVKGDNGLPPTLRNIVVTELEHDDATPASAEFDLYAEATDVAGPIYDVLLTTHKGAPGADGGTVLDPDDYGTAVAGRLLAVDSGLTGFELVPQRVGGTFWPTAVTEAPSATTAGFTVATISVPAYTYPFQWRPVVTGTNKIAGSGADVRVDLVAHLGSTGGPVVARGYGRGGVADVLTLDASPDVNATSGDITVAANAAAVIYILTEKQGGADTYSSSATRCGLRVHPIP